VPISVQYDDYCTSSQSIMFQYYSCANQTCGHSEGHGVCLQGQCVCFDLWYGKNCELITVAPAVQAASTNLSVCEGTAGSVNVSLSSGTLPVTWQVSQITWLTMLVSDNATSAVLLWESAAVTYQEPQTVTVTSSNLAGPGATSITIYVIPFFSAVLDDLSPSLLLNYDCVSITGHIVGTQECPGRNLTQSQNNVIIQCVFSHTLLELRLSMIGARFQSVQRQLKTCSVLIASQCQQYFCSQLLPPNGSGWDLHCSKHSLHT
jgi:hypothetical protein